MMDEQSISEDSSSSSEGDSNDKDGGDKENAAESTSTSNQVFNPSRESSNSVESNDEVNSDVRGAGPTPSKGKGESMTFIPGKHLQDKIRAKLLERSAATKGDGGEGVKREEDHEGEQLTPFRKYLEKWKANRKERRRAARGGVDPL